MADLSNYELDKGDDSASAPPPSSSRSLLTAALLIVVIGLGAFALVRFQRASSNVRLQTEQSVIPTSGNATPRAVGGDTIALAPLAETDPIVRDLVSRLSSHPTVVAWLTTDQLIRHFTVSVSNVADGQSPARHLKAVAPRGEFLTVSRDEIGYIDARSYQRYDGHADAVAALDAQGVARLYATLKPRIQDAARELGQPEDFDATMERAIVMMLATPVVEEPVRVVPAPVFWAFADPRLQSLSAAQRQLLRTGPRNVRLIQAKLREIAPYLGIPPEKLPEPKTVR